jgi:hypothetical protein
VIIIVPVLIVYSIEGMNWIWQVAELAILGEMTSQIGNLYSFIVFRIKFTTLQREFISPVGIPGAIFAMSVFVGVMIGVVTEGTQGIYVLITYLFFLIVPLIGYFVKIQKQQQFSAEEEAALFVAHVIRHNAEKKRKQQQKRRSNMRAASSSEKRKSVSSVGSHSHEHSSCAMKEPELLPDGAATSVKDMEEYMMGITAVNTPAAQQSSAVMSVASSSQLGISSSVVNQESDKLNKAVTKTASRWTSAFSRIAGGGKASTSSTPFGSSENINQEKTKEQMMKEAVVNSFVKNPYNGKQLIMKKPTSIKINRAVSHVMIARSWSRLPSMKDLNGNNNHKPSKIHDINAINAAYENGRFNRLFGCCLS